MAQTIGWFAHREGRTNSAWTNDALVGPAYMEMSFDLDGDASTFERLLTIDLDEDLTRRDVTINAIAVRVGGGAPEPLLQLGVGFHLPRDLEPVHDRHVPIDQDQIDIQVFVQTVQPFLTVRRLDHQLRSKGDATDLVRAIKSP